jgi:tetratricopeptide (TPR) repeat protein
MLVSPRRPLAVLLSLSLSMAPLLAPGSASAQDPDPAATEAQSLYKQGVAAYGSSDYEKAVELFRAAFEQAQNITDDELKGVVITTLWFNLARAQVKAYDIDPDAKRLRQAKDLIGKYLALDLSEDERRDADAVRSDVEARLAEAKPVPSDAPDTGDGTDSAGGGSDPATVEPTTDIPATDGKKPGRGLIIGGAVVGGVGLATGVALSATAAVMGRNAEDDYVLAESITERDDAALRGYDANTIGIVGLAAGGALLVTGAALVAVGVLKNKRAASAAPMAGRGTLGVTVGFRF